MCYLQHKKKLILLDEENHNFAGNEMFDIKGYIKVETGNNKGMLRAGVENLRYCHRGNYIYKLIFFGRKKEKTIYAVLGTLVLNPRGRSETLFRFDPQDIDGKGHELNDFSTVIVAALSTINKKEPLHPVLKGAMDQESPKRAKSYNIYYNQHIREGCRQLENKIEIYDAVVPFNEDVTGAAWHRITNVGRLPIITPGGRMASSKYRHFIFGIGDEYYFVGVPGRYLLKEQPEKGASGFLLWQPILGAEKFDVKSENCDRETIETVYGYWIAAINKETGEIEDIN